MDARPRFDLSDPDAKWFCAACGATYARRPERCIECGSERFVSREEAERARAGEGAGASTAPRDRASLAVGVGWRVLGGLIDFLLLGGGLYLLVIAVTPGPLLEGEMAAWQAVIGVLLLFRDVFAGRSPGKALLGLVAVDAKTLQPVHWKAAVVRNIPIVVFCASAIEVLVMLTRKDRQRLGDIMAGTIVVRARDLPG